METEPEYETQPTEQPTAEIIEEQESLPVKVETQIELYQGVATHNFTDDQQKKLLEMAPDEYIEIRPDGIVYMPEIRYRYILNTVFGPGKWALIRVQNPLYYDDKVGYHGSLFINGKFLSESIGEQTYRESNPLMSKFTAIESAKSDCITRCCKDLGIAWNLWDPKFIKAWKEKHAISVWCINKDGKKKPLWRLKADKPIDQFPWKEIGKAEPKKKSEPGKKTEPEKKVGDNTKKTPPKSDKTKDDKIKLIHGWLGDMGRWGFEEQDDGSVLRYKIEKQESIKENALSALKTISAFPGKDGKEDFKGFNSMDKLKTISDKWFNSVYGNVQTEYKVWKVKFDNSQETAVLDDDGKLPF